MRVRLILTAGGFRQFQEEIGSLNNKLSAGAYSCEAEKEFIQYRVAYLRMAIENCKWIDELGRYEWREED